MENLTDLFKIDWSIMHRLTLAILLGGAIGFERGLHGRPAGLRTHILVCIGATVIMIAAKIDLEIYHAVSQDVRLTIDPGRIVAGIMTGIGFLGAGAIIKMGDIVRGLTTAACIWFVAALGIVIGEGFYFLAILSTGTVLISLISLHHLETRLPSVVYHSIVVAAPIEQADTIEESCQAILEKENIRIKNSLHSISYASDRFEITFHVSMRKQMQSGTIIRALSKIPGIVQVSWH